MTRYPPAGPVSVFAAMTPFRENWSSAPTTGAEHGVPCLQTGVIGPRLT